MSRAFVYMGSVLPLVRGDWGNCIEFPEMGKVRMSENSGILFCCQAEKE